ncbi:2'-5' RNA ligase family protein [Hymenobacter wooponensis]|uniref:Mutarotase n=1 Tax=Hymenobacter wooponensis TaxID=1525360 RepID=A0A4Z0MHB5_9BACT|nr:2'-5' RNA ligase family protein [Hymenobacter wooponensis]TGD78869.1 mutarotase [Hymenobacter wooponensis]
MDLQQHYSTMRTEAYRHLTQGNVTLDPLIDSTEDTRRGITLLARPPAVITARLEALLADFRAIEPAQYYYPASDLHITVLSIISCYSGFTLDRIDPVAYQDAIRGIAQQTRPFRISFSGLTASPSSIIVQGFPHDSGLEQLRNQVRNFFSGSGLQQSIDQRYSIQTAHSTVLRFKSPLRDASALLENLRLYEQEAFGSFDVDTLELVYNDWYQRAGNTILLEKYPLQHQ